MAGSFVENCDTFRSGMNVLCKDVPMKEQITAAAVVMDADATGVAAGPQEIVLLLDDDETMLGILDGVLTGAGYSCRTSRDPLEALALIATDPRIAVALSDIFMPGMTGLEFVIRLNAMTLGHPRPKVLLLTGQPSLEAAVDALRLGARDFLLKPIRPAELQEAVGRAMAQSLQDRANAPGRTPQVGLLIRQAEELAGRLRNLAYSGGQEDEDASQESTASARPPLPPLQVSPAPAVRPGRHGERPSVLDTIEQLRRLRSRYDGHKLDDVAWDLLLELLRAERLHQRLSVSGLTISIESASPTTSLRRVNELAARGYITRTSDPHDARRDFVSLTDLSHQLLADYLARANEHILELTSDKPPPAMRLVQ